MFLLLLQVVHIAAAVGTVTVHYTSGGPPAYADSEGTYSLTVPWPGTTEYFEASSYDFNAQLASLSLGLAVSTFGQSSGNAMEFLTALGFSDVEFSASFANPGSATVGIVAARRTMTVEDKSFTLLAVGIRGRKYGAEFAGNADVGETGDHAGFDIGRKAVQEFVKSYVITNIAGKENIPQDLKLWVAGYGRAGAIANLFGASLNAGTSLADGVTLTNTNLFVFCFSAPACTSVPKQYSNIYNIKDKNDILPLFPPWLGRHGVTPSLPFAGRDSTYSAEKTEMNNALKNVEATANTESVVDSFRTKTGDSQRLCSGNGVSWMISDSTTNNVPLFSLGVDLISALTSRLSREEYVSIYQDAMVKVFSVFGASSAEQVYDIVNEIVQYYVQNFINLSPKTKEIASLDTDIRLRYASFIQNKLSVEQVDDTLTVSFITVFHGAFKMIADTNYRTFNTLARSLKHIAGAHIPELVFSWLSASFTNCQTARKNTALINQEAEETYRVLTVSQDADVYLYDGTNTLIASFVDGAPENIAETAPPYGIDYDEQVFFYLPYDTTYTVHITVEYDTAVSCTVMEYTMASDTPVRAVYYKDVPAKAEAFVVLSVGTDSYSLKDADGKSVEAEKDVSGEDAQSSSFYITAESSDSTLGIALGSGRRAVGTAAFISALPREDATFDGWYIDGNLLTRYPSCYVLADQDSTVTARFTVADDGKLANAGECSWPGAAYAFMGLFILFFLLTLLFLFCWLCDCKNPYSA